MGGSDPRKFIRKREKKTRFKVLISKDLVEDVESLEERARKLDLELDVAGVVEDALRRLVNVASKEFAKLEEKKKKVDGGVPVPLGSELARRADLVRSKG